MAVAVERYATLIDFLNKVPLMKKKAIEAAFSPIGECQDCPPVVDSKRVFTTLSLSEASPSASASVQNPSLTLPLTLTSTPKVGYYPIPVGISSILGAAQSTCRALAERLTQYVDHTSTHITCSLPCSRIQTWYMINLGAKPGGNLSLQCNWLPPDLPDAFFMIFQQRSSIRE